MRRLGEWSIIQLYLLRVHPRLALLVHMMWHMMWHASIFRRPFVAR